MTSKKFLSNKKTANQTISISPALKDWIERFVNVERKKHPNDTRFKSISSFYTYIMEKSMEILERGKSLEDFERFVDSNTENFFDSMTFKALIPFHEEVARTHRYTDITFKQLTRFLFAIRKLYLDGIEPYDYDTLLDRFEVFRKFYLENKIAKEMRLELFTNGNVRYPKAIFEFVGNYQNLFWENCKLNAAVLGIVGTRITDVIYSVKDLYCRFNISATDLIFRNDIPKKDRIKLVQDNVNTLINLKYVINDEDFYLWMKLAKDRGLIINFNNEKVKNRWIELIVNEIKKFGDKDQFKLDFLKFFEKLHWIEIESEDQLRFKIRLSEEQYKNEINWLLDLASKYSKVNQSNGKYYLE